MTHHLTAGFAPGEGEDAEEGHGDPTPYLELITAQHNQMPRFMRVILTSLQPIADALVAARRLPTLFDIDTAPGQQLDFLGQWIGLSRRIAVKDVEFFSWDTLDLGWDDGAWSSLYSDDHTIVVLDDDHYRLVLKARVASNHWDGTRQGAYDAWALYFAPMGYQILINDNFDRVIGHLTWDEPLLGWDNSYWDLTDMSTRGRCTGNMWMSLTLVGPPLDRLTEALFSGGYFDLRPAGVGIGYLAADEGEPVFCWDEGEEPAMDTFTLDGTAEQGLDRGLWAAVAAARRGGRALPAMAGWDEGTWARQLRPLEIGK